MIRAIAGLMAIPLALAAQRGDYAAAERKLNAIQMRRVPPGVTVVFTPGEINAWASVEVPKTVPHGLRQPQVVLGEGWATGSALVDFLKLRQARGASINWLMSRLLEGERPVSVTVDVRSGGGRATIYLRSVEISGVTVEGGVLDFLIKTFFLPLYPQAKIGEPFEMDDNIDRLDVRPDGVFVTIKK
ncbi:MAG: hypothetical protein ABI165_06190 [Bryobacteraceae bacterium]